MTVPHGHPASGVALPDGVVLAVEQLRRAVPGGIGRYAEGLLGGLASLASPGAPASPASPGAPGAVGIRVVASRHRGAAPDPLGAFGFPLRPSRLAAPWLTLAWDLGLAAVHGASVVHAVSLAAPPVRTRAGKAPVLVVSVHDLAWRAFPGATTRRGRRWHEAALRRALRRARAFVVPSAATARALVEAGARADDVRVIAHGVDHLPPPRTAEAAALLGRLGVGADYLLAAGTLEPRKNLARVAAAYAHARAAFGAPLPLVVVGPKGWGDARPPDSDGIVFAGPVSDAVLASLYATARAFVYVPLLEGFGLPPLEAMACGAPVVAGDAVPSVEVAPGTPPAALCVDPLDVEQIARAMVVAACDDARRAELVARGRAHAAAFTWARAAGEHVRWWSEVA